MSRPVLFRPLVAAGLASCLVSCAPSGSQTGAAVGTTQGERAQVVQASTGPLATGAAARESGQGLQPAAQGVPQVAEKAAKAVDYEELKALVPDVDGWTRSEVKGEQLNVPVSYSRAQVRYRRDDSRIELEIVDTALSPLLLAPLSVFLATGYSERSDEGFRTATKVGGQPGLEEWNALSQRGEVTALVANRFVVKATGHDVDTLDPLRAIVEKVDPKKLAAIRR